MSAASFMNEQPQEVKQEFLGFELPKLNIEQVSKLSLLTDVSVAELVLNYGIGAQGIYTDELGAAVEAQFPGSVLGIVAHIE